MNEQARGRRPLPSGAARSQVLKVRVRPGAAENFERVAADHGLSVAEAMREALSDWVVAKTLGTGGR